MNSFLQDLRYAARMLARNPGFTAVAVLTLALGIGATVAMFTVVNSVLLRPLPYSGADRIVTVYETDETSRRGLSRFYPPVQDFLYFRQQADALERMATYRTMRFQVTGGPEPELVRGLVVSHDFFRTLGIKPHLGRLFHASDCEPEAEMVVLISHEFWQTRFGGHPGVVGQNLRVNGRPSTIVGVLGPSVGPLERSKHLFMVWIASEDFMFSQRGSSGPPVIARMKPGVSLERAEAELNTIVRALAKQFPQSHEGRDVNLLRLRESVVQYARPTLYLLFGAVGFILLIACANVANLLLARATARGREMAVRTALGAARGRLIRQMLTESLMLSFLGAAAGFLLALAGVRALVVFRPPRIPRLDEIGVDPGVFLFAAGVAVLTGVLFGLAPALFLTGRNLTEGLRAGRGAGVLPGRERVRTALVVVEISLALVLLTGAGLTVKSFLHLLRVDSGIQMDNLLTFRVSQFENQYPTPASRHAFLLQALERLESIPGVESVAAVTGLPLEGNYSVTQIGLGGERPTRGNFKSGDLLWVSPGYFEALTIPVLQGRVFTHQDDGNSDPVAVVESGLARRYWPDENPIGRTIFIGFESKPRRVVGVVANVRYGSLERERRTKIYIPYLQTPQGYWAFLIRSATGPLALAKLAREEIRQIDPQLPVHDVRTMTEMFGQWLVRPRLYLVLFGVFAGLAATMAMVGIYGVMAYFVQHRTHEIGVRMALGAQRGDVLRMVLRQGLVLTAIGIAAGLVASYWLTKYLKSFLFEVEPTDPFTFAAVAVLLAVVALVACWIPARRATRVDPMTALRYE